VYEEDLNTLEDLLRKLKIEYDIFFNGKRKRPPEELHSRLEKLVKKLILAPRMSCAERFQLNTLLARYYLFRDVWRRSMSRQEKGIEKELQSIAEARHKASAGAAAQSGKQTEFQIQLSDPSTEQEKMQKLYGELMRLAGTKAKEAPKISFKQFSSYLSAQTQSIRQKHGCSSVMFILALENDAIKFRATAGSP
jgi:hypothetical protein